MQQKGNGRPRKVTMEKLDVLSCTTPNSTFIQFMVVRPELLELTHFSDYFLIPTKDLCLWIDKK